MQTAFKDVSGQLFELIASSEKTGFENQKDNPLTFYHQCTGEMENDSSRFLSVLLLNTYMANKGNGLSTENIYLRNYAVSQIQLFDMLIAKLPYVKYSQAIVNMQIAELLNGLEEATLLDIGIGLGTQVKSILKLCTKNTLLKKLVIVGIGPGV